MIFTHKILGLGCGIIVLLVSITGACWVFKEEIEALYEPSYTFSLADASPLSASRAREIAQMVFPEKEIHGTLFREENSAVEVIFYQAEPEEFYQSLFLHPYSGEVLSHKDHFAGFFAFVLRGHMYLWLPPSIGAPIVKYGILLFLVILCSGILLWLPPQWKNWRQRLKFHWKSATRWRRKNYDLHTIIGAYVFALALVFGFTGCVMSFPWFYYLTYKAVGGSKEPRFVIPANQSQASLAPDIGIDQLIPQLRKQEPLANSFELHYPTHDTASIYVEVASNRSVYYNRDYRFFDQNTLEELSTNSIYGIYQRADFSDTMIRMNYDIHVGAIGGLLGKLLAFLASLLVGSLPISGFLIWYGRKNKNRRKTPQKSSSQY